MDEAPAQSGLARHRTTAMAGFDIGVILFVAVVLLVAVIAPSPPSSSTLTETGSRTTDGDDGGEFDADGNPLGPDDGSIGLGNGGTNAGSIGGTSAGSSNRRSSAGRTAAGGTASKVSTGADAAAAANAAPTAADAAQAPDCDAKSGRIKMPTSATVRS